MSTSSITWKTIQNLEPGFHENCLKRQLTKTKDQDLITSLGNGALLWHSGNNLERACNLASRLLRLLSEDKLPIFNNLFNIEEKEKLFPLLLNEAINDKDERKVRVLTKNYKTEDIVEEEGLAHLQGMPQLLSINLSGLTTITEEQLAHLQGMPLQGLNLSRVENTTSEDGPSIS